MKDQNMIKLLHQQKHMQLEQLVQLRLSNSTKFKD
jgi:hypothetical protein